MAVYDAILTYNVTAGVGPINGSYVVVPFMEHLQSLAPEYPYQVLPYNYFAAAYNLVTTPMYTTLAEPISCNGSDCFAYLLSGGLEMVTPWTPVGHIDYPLVKIVNVPAIHMEVSGSESYAFLNRDCNIYGASGTPIGIRLCVAEKREAGTMEAGTHFRSISHTFHY